MGTAPQRRPGPASTRYRPSPHTRTKCKAQLSSVADPDPLDSYVFGKDNFFVGVLKVNDENSRCPSLIPGVKKATNPG
jgi:hypothetical protein